MWKIPSALGRSTCEHSALHITSIRRGCTLLALVHVISCECSLKRSHEGKHQRPTASKSSTMFHVVFCHRLESRRAQDDKSEHPSLKETSVQRPSQRNPAQTKAHTAHTAHTKLEGLSAHFSTCLAAFFPPTVQEFQALTLKQRRRLVTRKLLNIKYSDLVGFFQGRQIDCMDPALARE